MDKISERVYQQMKSSIPEDILGKMTVSVSQLFTFSSESERGCVSRGKGKNQWNMYSGRKMNGSIVS